MYLRLDKVLRFSGSSASIWFKLKSLFIIYIYKYILVFL